MAEPPVGECTRGQNRHGPDAETEGRRPLPALAVWGLATFHVTALVVVLVVALHVAGPLGELLSGLNTAVGLGVFAYLWALTWWTNRRALAGAWDGDGFDSRAAAKRATLWGGVTGVCFLLAPLVASSAFLVIGGASVLAVLAIGLLAALVSAAVGALVGGVFGAVDVVLLRAVDAVRGRP
ncbi:hypothetical protein [Haloprofundus sp. MHR1]|uniref:hypothetical protein n=1 Tax=Haloprofundus sp. MHR1 TaxID=2572921 RepID=UPI0010BEB6D9|nr:hypothetical protein [Haloprofundus sp. MHR1]QCJ45807.1 hypothetical protein FCF25_01145 [Haloprofundus sp. MHR1]